MHSISRNATNKLFQHELPIFQHLKRNNFLTVGQQAEAVVSLDFVRENYLSIYPSISKLENREFSRTSS